MSVLRSLTINQASLRCITHPSLLSLISRNSSTFTSFPINPLPTLPLTPSSTHHHDLPSFLAYAKSASLSSTSTVYVGTYYEYLCASTLSRLAFTLTRTGGPSDHGIDLLGHWHLPCLPYPLRVLIQCKALKANAAPESVRELQGAFAGAPAAWQGVGTVGVLCAKKKVTGGVRRTIMRCAMPVMWVMVEDLGEGEGRVRQVLWNRKVDELGAEGMAVGLKYLPGLKGKGGVERETILMWQGLLWEPEVKSKDGNG